MSIRELTIHTYKMVAVKEIEDAVVVANINLNAKVHGSGDIEYKGTPSQKDIRIFGS
jgi:ribosome recycling factor